MHSIAWYSDAAVLTGDADGTLVFWKAGNWAPYHTAKAHKAAIVALDIHPSGTVALSADLHARLILWDLTKGMNVGKMKLRATPVRVRWAPEGNAFAVLYNGALQVHGAGDEQVQVHIPLPSRGCDFVFLDTSVVVVGCEDGSLRVWTWRELPGERTWPAIGVAPLSTPHTRRIRCLAVVNTPVGDEPAVVAPASVPKAAPKVQSQEANAGVPLPKRPLYLVTADSDGIVMLWDAAGLCDAVVPDEEEQVVSDEESEDEEGLTVWDMAIAAVHDDADPEVLEEASSGLLAARGAAIVTSAAGPRKVLESEPTPVQPLATLRSAQGCRITALAAVGVPAAPGPAQSMELNVAKPAAKAAAAADTPGDAPAPTEAHRAEVGKLPGVAAVQGGVVSFITKDEEKKLKTAARNKQRRRKVKLERQTARAAARAASDAQGAHGGDAGVVMALMEGAEKEAALKHAASRRAVPGKKRRR